LEEVRTFEAIPAWLAAIVVSLRVLDDGSHSDLLLHPSPLPNDGSGWGGRLRVASLMRVRLRIFLGTHEGQVADAMIEAIRIVIPFRSWVLVPAHLPVESSSSRTLEIRAQRSTELGCVSEGASPSTNSQNQSRNLAS